MHLSPVTVAASAGALAAALVTTAGIVPAHAAAGPAPAAPTHLAPRVRPVSVPFAPGALPRTASAATTSSNWAGYAATGSTFTSVRSSWVQPKVTCTANGIVAFWVGLDGYGSASVEQTGTGADCSTGTARYFAWWETYPENSMQSYQDAVAPGDVLSATVTSLGGGQYELDLTDSSKGWAEHGKVSSPGAANASAEIVAEAVTEGSTVSALPDFDSAMFSASQINRASAPSAKPEAIDMTDANGTTIASTGSMDPSGDFAITYQTSQSVLGPAAGLAHSVPLEKGSGRA